jgi:hypothetical protein
MSLFHIFLHIQGVLFRESSIEDLIEYGNPPRNSMPRVCGLCKQDVLDDAFTRYKKLNPERYVLRFMRVAVAFKAAQNQPKMFGLSPLRIM